MKHRRVSLAAPLAFALLAIPGCIDSPQVQDEPAKAADSEVPITDIERLEAALERFKAELGPDGGVARMEMRFGSWSMEWRFGSDGSASYGAPFSGTLYCSDEAMTLAVGGEVYVARGRQAEPCDMATFHSTEEDPERELVAAEPRDGGMDYIVDETSASETQRVIYKLDAQERVLQIVFDDGDFVSRLVPEYATRAPIEWPTPTARWPEQIEYDEQFAPGNLSATFGNGAGVELDEFEVRIQQGGEVVARLPLGEAHQAVAGFTLHVQDDDGTHNHGDRIWLVHDGWETRDEFQVDIWDLWADRAINFHPSCSEGMC